MTTDTHPMTPYWEVSRITDELREAARCSRWDLIADLGTDLQNLSAQTTGRKQPRRCRWARRLLPAHCCPKTRIPR